MCNTETKWQILNGFNKQWRNRTPWMHLCLLKSHLGCLAVYIYFVLNSAQSSGKRKNWKCDSEELFERKLIVYFVLHYSRKRFVRKGFDPELWDWNLFNCNTDCVSCLHPCNWDRKGFLSLVANMLSVSINVSWERFLWDFSPNERRKIKIFRRCFSGNLCQKFA